jgi:hypothetical protein
VETTVTPNTNFVRGGILIGFAANLGHGLGGLSEGRNLSKSSRLPTTTDGVGTPQMVFTNLIMTTRVNKNADQPPMNSIAAKGYKNTDVGNPIKGYQEPSMINVRIFNHINGHSMKLNLVDFNYLNSKKMLT